ncbi:MAG: hypothetical protein HZC38_20135 [Chloroflexi bacterium]|nr:hypothetical protein [Chloroflexota bacterium]MBI5080813.1 hypothetical protein [Chloroflexota bacterium]MBI5715714.1 hypothetical protein [Chloroflexota bacterium]
MKSYVSVIRVSFFLVMILSLAALACSVSDSGSAAGDFMTALKGGDYAKAYGMCGADLQKELGSSQGLQKFIESGNFQPVSWNFTSTNVNNDRAEVSGEAVVGSDNRAMNISVILSNASGSWQVIGFNLTKK